MAGDAGELVAALRAGDEAAFARIVQDWSRPMLTLARGFVSTQASAEEVVQETWLAVLKGIDRFEGRSSLRTWVFRILVNTAKSRGVKEHRTLPWSSIAGDEAGPGLDPALFQSAGEPYPGHWRAAPSAWPEEVAVEGSVLAGEVRRELASVLETLPDRQRIVLTLRDVLGHSSEEVCELLGISQANQRVLLHRARTAARAGIAAYVEGS
ncbi:RNA polymerase sigma factor [Nocardioides halotolerans]|uniref:RNA polymerase sigma factor n=1 Tax=Nocardioides halotolerans TaxID=433660 RepID=UPI000400529D|nr:sigma-70 family RNA polymerase sigma factor [Nocardioides halotolerans]